MVHSEIAQNRGAGAGTAKKNNAIMARQSLQLREKALRATLVDAIGTVWLLLSAWSECRVMRISGSRYLRAELLCWCQRGSKTSSVAKPFLS